MYPHPPVYDAEIPNICKVAVDTSKRVVKLLVDGEEISRTLDELRREYETIIVLNDDVPPCRLQTREQCIVGSFLGIKLFNNLVRYTDPDEFSREMVVPIDHSGYIMSVYGVVSQNPFDLFRLVMNLVGAVIDSCPDSLHELVEQFNSFPFLSVIDGPIIGNVDMYYLDGLHILVCRDEYEPILDGGETLAETFTRYLVKGETEGSIFIGDNKEYCVNKLRKLLIETENTLIETIRNQEEAQGTRETNVEGNQTR